MLIQGPIFIFPVFAIFFILTGKNDAREITYIAAASVFFDFFSGYTFGFSTFIILVIVLAVFFFKTRFSVNHKSFLSLAVYTMIFTFAHFAILSVKSEPQLIVSQAAAIITETMILFLIFVLTHRKFIKD